MCVFVLQRHQKEMKYLQLQQQIEDQQKEMEMLQVDMVRRNDLYEQQCQKYADRKLRTKNKFQKARCGYSNFGVWLFKFCLDSLKIFCVWKINYCVPTTFEKQGHIQVSEFHVEREY